MTQRRYFQAPRGNRAPRETEREREARLRRHPTHRKSVGEIRLTAHCRHLQAGAYDVKADEVEAAGDTARAARIRLQAARYRSEAAHFEEFAERQRRAEALPEPHLSADEPEPIAEALDAGRAAVAELEPLERAELEPLDLDPDDADCNI